MRKSSNLQITLNPVCRPQKNEQYISISEKKIVSLQKTSIAKETHTSRDILRQRFTPIRLQSQKKHSTRQKQTRQDSEEQSMKKKWWWGLQQTFNRFTETERELWRLSMTQEAEDEQNKGRAAGCGADDTPVLQEEGGQRGVMPRMPRVATVRCSKTGTLQVWRKQAYMQEVSHPLLSPSDERTNVQSDALGWTENDSAPSGCCHQAYHKRIVTTGNGHEWRICKWIKNKIKSEAYGHYNEWDLLEGHQAPDREILWEGARRHTYLYRLAWINTKTQTARH